MYQLSIVVSSINQCVVIKLPFIAVLYEKVITTINKHISVYMYLSMMVTQIQCFFSYQKWLNKFYEERNIMAILILDIISCYMHITILSQNI